MKVYYRAVILASLLLATTLGARAQSGGSPPAAVASKVGILNVRQAIVNTAEGKQAAAELQSQFAARQTDLENLRKQIEDLQNRLRNCERTCSEEEKSRLTREGDLKARQFQRKQDDFQEELNAAQAEVFERISRKMQDVLDRYARENGYTVVFDTSIQQTPVVYASSQVDVTQDVVRLYDQAYPVKPGTQPAATRPQPSAPKPQPPAPKPQPPAQKPPQD